LHNGAFLGRASLIEERGSIELFAEPAADVRRILELYADQGFSVDELGLFSGMMGNSDFGAAGAAAGTA
jgi:hypothetical protein